jgi:membrane protein required for colicin V production
MNAFDAFVYAVAVIAIVAGFNAGLLRSLATILAYLAAAPIAVAITPQLIGMMTEPSKFAPNETWLALGATFLAVGLLIGALLRFAIGEFTGHNVSIADRLAGAALGAVRIGLVAVLIVVVFDRIIPPNRQPWFLVGSQLRPYLSAAGQKGLKSLPPEAEAYIERLKRERGI